MKNIIIIVLILLGLYWLFAHAALFPFSHESFGLYEHTIHRIIGVVVLVIGVVLAWRWKVKG